MNLNDWAKQNNLSYTSAWRRFKAGEIPNATQDSKGFITIPEPLKEAKASVNSENLPVLVTSDGKQVQFSEASTRRNVATTISPTDRYANIESGILPFKQISGGMDGGSMMSARDAILLCMKAYFNFSDVRSLLDYSASVATGKIYFKGGNKKAKDFFTAWLKKIGSLSLQEQWYKERLRSGNCFLYRQDGIIRTEDIKSLTQTYGASIASEQVKLPIRYILLNPADVALQTSAAFTTPIYHKLVNDYELAVLRAPRTPADQELFDSLKPEIQKQIKSRATSTLYIPLETDKILYYGYKKSDFEAFGISLLFSILDDLEFYAELRRGDAAINRTLQQAVLLVTMGYQDKEGNMQASQPAMNAMARLFENQSVARVVVSTFDTKMEFLVPDIADILDPVKYQVVRERIKEGLNNILTGSGEKYSNRSAGIQLFLQQIKTARNEFLEYFLQPEIKRIAQLLGFKNYPEAVYEDISLKDEVEFSRMITRLNEIGTLTPSETIEAIQTGKLPTEEDSLENQEKLRKWKDKGLYSPVAGGIYEQTKLAKLKTPAGGPAAKLPKMNGRPTGSPQPKIKKKISPIKASLNENIDNNQETDENEVLIDISEQKYDLNKIAKNLNLAAELESNIISELKKKHSLAELNDIQQEIVKEIVEKILTNEEPANWLIKAKEYIDNPDKELDSEKAEELELTAYYHQVDNYLGNILRNSKI